MAKATNIIQTNNLQHLAKNLRFLHKNTWKSSLKFLSLVFCGVILCSEIGREKFLQTFQLVSETKPPKLFKSKYIYLIGINWIFWQHIELEN